jgi:hypothetical protein
MLIVYNNINLSRIEIEWGQIVVELPEFHNFSKESKNMNVKLRSFTMKKLCHVDVIRP